MTTQKSLPKILALSFLTLLAEVFLWPSDTYAVDSLSISPKWAAYVANSQNEDSKYTEAGCENTTNTSTSCGYWINDTYGSANIGQSDRNLNITKINLKHSGGQQLAADDRLDWLYVTYTGEVNDLYATDYQVFSNQGATLPGDYANTTYYEPVATVSEQTWYSYSTSASSTPSANTSITVLYRILPSTRNRTGNTTLLQHFTFPTGNGSARYFNVKNAVFVEDYTSYLQQLNLTLDQIKSIVQQISTSSSQAGVIDAIDDQTEQEQQHYDEPRQEAQDAQQQAQTDGADSQADAQQGGQSLLAALISFIGAITNASPSNCNIPMDTGFIDFGNVNLCSLTPPPAFQVISSIVVIGFAVPLSIAASKKMIELFRSFTG